MTAPTISTLEERAVSSMNFFFLRVVVGRETPEIIIEELEGFLEKLDLESTELSPGIRHQIRTEIEEGDYFDNTKSLNDARALINKAVIHITGNKMPKITDLYARFITEAGLLKDKRERG